MATVWRENEEHKVPIDEISVDEEVVCHPGERIATDGKGGTLTWMSRSLQAGALLQLNRLVTIAGSINGEAYPLSKVVRLVVIPWYQSIVHEA